MDIEYWSFGLAPLLVTLTCLLIIAVRAANSKAIRLIDWSLMFIALVYGIMAPTVINAVMQRPGQFAGGQFVPSRLAEPFAPQAVAVLIMIIGLLLGWAVNPWRRRASLMFAGLSGANRFASWFWVMAIGAIVAQYIYAIDYDGFLGVFDYSLALRSGVLDDALKSRFSFLAPLAGFSIIACYGFLGLILRREGRPRSAWMGFVVAFVFAIYVLISLQGRVGLVVFVASIGLGIVFVNSRNPLMIAFGFPAAVIIGVVALRLSSEILKRGSSASNLQFMTQQVSFVYTGFWAWSDNPNISFRYFYDLIVAPIFLLPSSLTAGHFSRVGDIHTAEILGAPKGVDGVMGAMPLDLVTLGYLQFGLLGVFVCALIFGAILRVLQNIVDGIEHDGIRAVFEAHVSLKIAGLGLIYAEPENLIRGNLPLIFIVFAVWLFRGRLQRRDQPAGHRLRRSHLHSGVGIRH